MSNLTKALAALRPRVNCADTDGTLAGIRWDAPLPEGFVAPTQEEVDAALASLDVPKIVTAAQMIRALDREGLLAPVKTAVHDAGGLTLELWNHAPYFHRDDALIGAVAAALGKSDAEVDALFVLAATF